VRIISLSKPPPRIEGFRSGTSYLGNKKAPSKRQRFKIPKFGIVDLVDNAQMNVIETHAWLARGSKSFSISITNSS
jgi:hypothetical protein